MANRFKLGTDGLTKKRKREANGPWHVKIRLGTYQHKRVRLCSDATVSANWAHLLQGAVDRVRANEPVDRGKLRGVPARCLRTVRLAPALNKSPHAPWAEHVADYLDELRTAGRDQSYVYNLGLYLRQVADGCDWKTLNDVDRHRFMIDQRSRREGGRSPRTLNNISASVNGFLIWQR